MLKYLTLLIFTLFFFACKNKDTFESALQHPEDIIVLDLTYSKLDTLTKDIAKFKNLEELNLLANNITVIPDELWELTKLKKLNLGWNKIDSISPKVGHLQNLEELNLAKNSLTKLPATIGELKKLTKINISWNKIRFIPSQLLSSTSLKEFLLYDNPISGSEELLKTFKNVEIGLEYTLKQNEANYFLRKAVNYHQFGDIKEALRYYEKALKRNPKLADAYANRGILKHNSGDMKGALIDYNNALKIKPKMSRMVMNRGLIKLNLKDIKGACADWNIALKMGEKNAQTYILKYCTQNNK